MSRIISLGVFTLLIGVLCADAEMRIWTSKKGQNIEAEFVALMGEKVVLRTPEGKQLRVPVSGLIKADREYLMNSIPPRLKITVDTDVDRHKHGDGYYYETKRENITVKVTIQKVNRGKSSRKFKARLYLLAESQSGSNKQLIGKSDHTFSFVGQNIISFSARGDVESEQSYYSKGGYEYEGYVVCVEDENGKVIAVESNKNSFKENYSQLKSAGKGDELTKDLYALN